MQSSLRCSVQALEKTGLHKPLKVQPDCICVRLARQSHSELEVVELSCVGEIRTRYQNPIICNYDLNVADCLGAEERGAWVKEHLWLRILYINSPQCRPGLLTELSDQLFGCAGVSFRTMDVADQPHLQGGQECHPLLQQAQQLADEGSGVDRVSRQK